MRELDLLFEQFLVSGFDMLDEQQLLELERLLAQPDQDILAWISDSQEAPASFREIVEKIRGPLK